MARKSSKTAHVMNLLAGEESESSKSEAAKENLAASLNTDSSETIKELTVLAHQASIQTKEGPLSPSPISIIDMSSTAPDPVSELIRQQLAEEEGIITDTQEKAPTENEMGTDDGTQDDPSPVLTAAEVKVYTSPAVNVNNSDEATYETEDFAESPKKNPELEPNDTDTDENINYKSDETLLDNNIVMEANNTIPEDNAEFIPSEALSMEENSLMSDSSDTEGKTASDSASPDSKGNQNLPSYQYLNIMEYVVKSMVDYYAEKFDTCTCGRCIADITALTLTKLPPKYIVAESNSASPLLNFYMNRYSQQVIVELTKSCSIVKQNPHH